MPTRRSPSGRRCCTRAAPWWPAPARASSSRSATETEIGRLGRLVAEAKEPPTPLQRAMAELARAALIVAVTACVLVPLVGVLRGQPAREMLLDGLTLAFATIPEELPILVTVLVALGGLRWRSTASCCAGCAPPRPSVR